MAKKFSKRKKGGANIDEGVKMEKRDDRLSSLNDISWYTHNPDLIMAAGNFPYPYRPGMTMDLGVAANDEYFVTPYGVPGIAVLVWDPSIGWCEKSTDPANVAAREIYARIRESYSGTLEVQPADLMIYLMALDSIYAYIGSLKRIFRTLRSYSPNNFMMPNGLLQAQGVPANKIDAYKQDQMKLFQYINELVAMAAKFTCPAIMDIFNRHYWMNDNVYTDAPSPNSQMFIFRQMTFYKYGLSEGSTPYGMLTAKTPTFTSVDTLYQFGIELIDALASHEDSFIINGYFMRAFDGVPTFAAMPIEYGEVIEPVYVEEVLSQIENSSTIPFGLSVQGNYAPTITQDPLNNVIKHMPIAKNTIPEALYAAGMGISGGNVLSSRFDAPTAADNTIATRLKVPMYPVKMVDETTAGMELHCGTEIPEFWLLYTPTTDGGTFEYVSTQIRTASLINDPSQTEPKLNTSYTLTSVAKFTVYDWFPIVTLYQVLTSMGQTTVTPLVFGDIHNVTSVTNEQLANLHRMCIYSEFNAFGIS